MAGETLSIVVPCYNEADNVVKFAEAVDKLQLDAVVEYVFVDDGSTDGTLEALKSLQSADPRIHYVSFSRNFGKESALLAGLEFSSGSYVVTMDADLQHRPALLPEMLKEIRSDDVDCVAVKRESREGESRLRAWLSSKFYGVMGKLSEIQVHEGHMDYRMMKRRVVDAVLSMREANRFTKGIYQWVGFKTKWIVAKVDQRVDGKSKWSLWSLFCYSARGIVSFSTAPLQLASLLGALFSIPAFFYMVFVMLQWAFCGNKVSGWATLICAILFIGGIQLLVAGILGTYLAFVYREVKRRPPYIVRERQ